MIRDSIAFFREAGREVIYDAEHFFDGWKANPDYARKTIRAAVEGGAMIVVMCDTNGGSMPEEVAALTKEAAAAVERAAGHPHAQRLRPGRGQFARRHRRRRRPRAGHDQRPRRTLRQCRPRLGDRQPRAQEARLRSARRHAASSISPSCRATCTKSPTCTSARTSRSSAPAHSPTKAACTCTPSNRAAQQLRAHVAGSGRQRRDAFS